MSEEILCESLRPRRLSELYGQDALVRAIRNHVAKRPPQAWLFHGGTGTGKTTVANILAVSYQCPHMKVWGEPCDACYQNRSGFSIHDINASEVNGIEELGRVVELSRFRPSNLNGRRVVILDEAQKISNSAQNMLLKPFEKPADHTVWIICTTEPSKLLETLRRRCTTYQLKQLGISAAEDFLQKQANRVGITRPLEPLFEACHLMDVSAPALLLQALEKYAAGTEATDAVSGTDGSSVESLRVCKAVTSGDWEALKKNLKSATPGDARFLRASVAGWLRGVLVRETNPAAQERAAVSLTEMCSPPFEDAMMLQWLYGTLYRICRRYRR